MQDVIDVVYGVKAGTVINSYPDLNDVLGFEEDLLQFEKTINFPLIVSKNPEQNYIEVHYLNPNNVEVVTTPQVSEKEGCIFYAFLPHKDGELQHDKIKVVFSKEGVLVAKYPTLYTKLTGPLTVNFTLIVDVDSEKNHVELHYFTN